MKKRIYAHILLDRSGSMMSCRAQAISGVNEYIGSLAADTDLSSRVSMTIFDDRSIDLIRDNKKARECPTVTDRDFVPRGWTPLYDAIGKTVMKIDAETRREGENVALVIMTDGLENMSKEFTEWSAKALLADRQAKGWLVIYLGANQDALAVGQTIGVSAANSMTYDTNNARATMSAASRGTRDYGLTGSAAAASFTDEERKKAMSPIP